MLSQSLANPQSSKKDRNVGRLKRKKMVAVGGDYSGQWALGKKTSTSLCFSGTSGLETGAMLEQSESQVSEWNGALMGYTTCHTKVTGSGATKTLLYTCNWNTTELKESESKTQPRLKGDIFTSVIYCFSADVRHPLIVHQKPQINWSVTCGTETQCDAKPWAGCSLIQ